MPWHRLVCGLLLAVLARHGAASPLFDDDDVIDIGLTGPFESLFQTTEQPVYLPFSLETGGTTRPVEIRVRGHSRLRVCEFPPLRLNFRAGPEATDPFEGQDELKLVTHCRNYDRGEQDLLEEYAAYRILNVVTSLSYRVRLLRVHYRDTGGELPPQAEQRYAFAIEPAAEFARRTGARAVDLKGFPLNRHDQHHAALMYVLQYLVANTDWQLLKADYEEACCHNADLFERDSLILFVPYDFDVSGLVNAQYAFPDPRLRIRSVRQRLYRGLCTERSLLREALVAVTSKEDELLAVIRDLPGLEPRNAERALRYLADFFDDARDQDRLLDSFERRCVQSY